MRGILLGALVGLAIGTLGAFAYSHYLGEGQRLARLQTQLDAANATLAKNAQDTQQLKSETGAMSTQIQQLIAKKEDLTHQVDELKNVPAAVSGNATPAVNPMAGMVKAQIAQRQEQRLLLLKSRLHLTPEQEATVKAAMDEESKHMEDMTAKMFQGGKIDPQAMKDARNSTSLDQTLASILTPDQKTAYEQMKTDEKNSQTETVASFELNQMAPLLQLSDAQKDQVYSALYQVQTNAQDPAWIKNNLPASSDPSATLDAQAKAKEDALAKILTPEQLATYHQQAQAQLDMQKTMIQKFTLPAGAAPAPAPAPPP